MTIKELDGYSNIGNGVYSCMFAVDDVPEEYINEAKYVDGDSYIPNCMVVHAYYDTVELSMIYDLLYITEMDGDLSWPCELSDEDESKMLDMIRKEIVV